MDMKPRVIRRIVVGSGVTAESAAVLRAAVGMARRLEGLAREGGEGGVEVHAVHVIEPAPVEAEEALPGIAAAHVAHAREELERFKAEHGVGEKELGVRWHVRVGVPEAEILGTARPREVGGLGADLVVMGRYGRGGRRRGAGGGVQMGRVVDRVVRKCPVSVLVVDPEAGGGAARGEFARIGVATDFSEASELAIRRALELGRAMGASEVVLLHAYEVPRGYHTVMTYEEACERLEAVAAKRAESWGERLGGAGGPKLRLRATHGPAGTRVPELAALEGLDLLVVHTHGRSRAAMFMMERMTEKILHGAACAVWAEKSPELYQGMGEAVGELLGV